MRAKSIKLSKYSHSSPTPKMHHQEYQQQTRPLNRFIMDKTAGYVEFERQRTVHPFVMKEFHKMKGFGIESTNILAEEKILYKHKVVLWKSIEYLLPNKYICKEYSSKQVTLISRGFI